MKEFEKWMNIGTEHKIVREYIPLGYQPTLPLVFRESGKEYICFFYYYMAPKKITVFLKAPKYYIQFEVQSRRLAEYKEYEKEHELGYCEEIFQEDYAKRQMEYIECFEKMIPNVQKLSDEELRDIANVWYDAQLKLLQGDLCEHTWDMHVD